MTITTPPYGRDTSATSRVHYGKVVSGGTLLAEACYRRLISERSALEDDLTYGFALANKLGASMTLDDRESLAPELAAELKKDERIDDVTVSIIETQTEGASVALDIEIEGIGKEGEEFGLALRAKDAKVELLHLWGE